MLNEIKSKKKEAMITVRTVKSSCRKYC